VSREYSSQFKGVVFVPSVNATRPWQASIRINGKRRHLGYFAREEEAHAARQAALVASGERSKRSGRWVSGIACYDDDRDWVEGILVELTQAKWAKVDVEDIPLVIGRAWRYSSEGYACTADYLNRRNIQMHRLLLGLPPGRYPQVDHINHQTLDNRRSNLRVATYSQSQANTRKRKGTTSQFKGVYWLEAKGLWTVRIGVDGERRFLGNFQGTPEGEREAARAYNAAAIEAFGEFAHLNMV
jgi:hypothetical protein